MLFKRVVSSFQDLRAQLAELEPEAVPVSEQRALAKAKAQAAKAKAKQAKGLAKAAASKRKGKRRNASKQLDEASAKYMMKVHKRGDSRAFAIHSKELGKQVLQLTDAVNKNARATVEDWVWRLNDGEDLETVKAQAKEIKQAA